VNAVAYVAFAAVFLTCTVVFLGFVLVAWLGWTLGLLWTAVVTPFAVFLIWRLHGYASFRNTGVQGEKGEDLR
jgi:hypothetical protein